jgi:hypothetical protein
MQIQSTGFTTFREQDGLAADRVFSVLTDHDRAVLADTIPSTVAAHQWSGCAGFPEASPADLARTNPKACYAQDTEIFRVFRRFPETPAPLWWPNLRWPATKSSCASTTTALDWVTERPTALMAAMGSPA